MIESTADKLHQMRLSVMARAYSEQQNANGIYEMGFDERFAMVVDAEWDARRVNKRTRLLRQAAFAEPEANVTDVIYDSDRGLDRARILELSNCGWIREKRSIIITGASGAGKSWIACALGVAACNSFFSVRYVRMPQMVDDLTALKDETWLKTKKKYLRCDVLVIDDWLLEPADSGESREILEIIESRQRTGSLILCSQFASSGWYERLGEGAIADAVIDRIIYNSHVIHVKGEESMRKRLSTLRE